MIEENATVLRCSNGYAELETQPNSSCGGCSAKGACGTAALGKVLGRGRPTLRVTDTLGLKPGDRVVIGLQEAALTRASAAAYLVPLLAMITVAILGDAVGGEPGALLGGLIGMSGGLLWLARFGRKMEGDARFQAVLLRRSPSPGIAIAPSGLQSFTHQP